ncbi:MAG TPA: ribonuclease Z [Flavobacterium sp.]|jgi:hypothetical protein|nr:ribonuclease Z [Flavobacterium sp.]HPJ10619.1 ribonuclease Z [Flavobacterium sp.]
MRVEQKGKNVVIKDTQGDLVAFLMKVTHEYKTFEKHNIIIDISLHEALTVKDVNGFLPLSKMHKKVKKSFVIVVRNIDYNAVSTQLTVVPTLLEATDMIEMEEIERDLGF